MLTQKLTPAGTMHGNGWIKIKMITQIIKNGNKVETFFKLFEMALCLMFMFSFMLDDLIFFSPRNGFVSESVIAWLHMNKWLSEHAEFMWESRIFMRKKMLKNYKNNAHIFIVWFGLLDI